MWESCTFGKVLQVGVLYSWQGSPGGSLVVLVGFSRWESCTLGKVLQVGILYS